jgi:hypothetical protein
MVTARLHPAQHAERHSRVAQHQSGHSPNAARDGVITEQERLEPKPPIKVDRVSALERRVEALERKLSGLHARHEPSVCGNPNGSQEN